jgi:hypothetical protein
METLHDIGSEISGHGFRLESWEIARKDGGVFMHFSYVPPDPEAVKEKEPEPDLGPISGVPEVGGINPTSPGKLFLSQLLAASRKHGGFPSWLGQWWASRWEANAMIPGHTLWTRYRPEVHNSVGLDETNEGGTVVKSSGTGMRGIQAIAGGGRVWIVKGRQWTEVCKGSRKL